MDLKDTNQGKGALFPKLNKTEFFLYVNNNYNRNSMEKEGWKEHDREMEEEPQISNFFIKEESLLDLLYEGLCKDALKDLRKRVNEQVLNMSHNNKIQLKLDTEQLVHFINSQPSSINSSNYSVAQITNDQQSNFPLDDKACYPYIKQGNVIAQQHVYLQEYPENNLPMNYITTLPQTGTGTTASGRLGTTGTCGCAKLQSNNLHASCNCQLEWCLNSLVPFFACAQNPAVEQPKPTNQQLDTSLIQEEQLRQDTSENYEAFFPQSPSAFRYQFLPTPPSSGRTTQSGTDSESYIARARGNQVERVNSFVLYEERQKPAGRRFYHYVPKSRKK